MKFNGGKNYNNLQHIMATRLGATLKKNQHIVDVIRRL